MLHICVETINKVDKAYLLIDFWTMLFGQHHTKNAFESMFRQWRPWSDCAWLRRPWSDGAFVQYDQGLRCLLIESLYLIHFKVQQIAEPHASLWLRCPHTQYVPLRHGFVWRCSFMNKQMTISSNRPTRKHTRINAVLPWFSCSQFNTCTYSIQAVCGRTEKKWSYCAAEQTGFALRCILKSCFVGF